MEKLVPVTEYGVIPQPLLTSQLSYVEDGLVVDLIPRSAYLERPPVDDLAPGNPLRDVLDGAGEVAPGERFLRLTFGFIEAMAFSTVEQAAHPLAWKSEIDGMPRYDGHDWPYPFVEVAGSDWGTAIPSEQNHYRILTMKNRLDLLAYEPKGQWQEREMRR